MKINPNIIETSHDLDALIRAAKIHPTEGIIQKLIDLEIDGNGNHIGFAAATHYWHQALAA